mgnify:CR=1 FL=1
MAIESFHPCDYPLLYQSLEKIEGRALLYQKYLLSDNTENKLDLLFLLKDLFKKEKSSRA